MARQAATRPVGQTSPAEPTPAQHEEPTPPTTQPAVEATPAAPEPTAAPAIFTHQTQVATRGRGHRLSNSAKAEIIQLGKLGKSPTEIAAVLPYAYATIRNTLQSNNIFTSGQRGRPSSSTASTPSGTIAGWKEKIEWAEFHIKHFSNEDYQQIADEYKIHATQVEQFYELKEIEAAAEKKKRESEMLIKKQQLDNAITNISGVARELGKSNKRAAKSALLAALASLSEDDDETEDEEEEETETETAETE